MSELTHLSVPVPPATANPEEMLKWMQSIYTWFQNTVAGGVQAPFFSQTEITGMTKLDQSGKLVFNNDTGKAMIGEIVEGALVMKTIVTE